MAVSAAAVRAVSAVKTVMEDSKIPIDALANLSVGKGFAEHKTVAHILERKRLGACATLVDTLARGLCP